jgi:hypothetical protein
MEMKIGVPDEQAYFSKEHALFLERLPRLHDTARLAFTCPLGIKQEADKVVAGLCGSCVADFNEILVLAANGYGIGAMKLVRTMYEEAVTASYLHLHPEEAEDYIAYGRIQQYKVAKRVHEEYGEAILSGEKMAEVKARRDEVRARFQVELCPECHRKGDNFRWTKLDFVSLTKHAGAVGTLELVGYSIPLMDHHGAVTTLLSRLDESPTELVYDGGPSRSEAAQALVTAHHILLHALQVQMEHFSFQDLSTHLQRCWKDFEEVWGERSLKRSASAKESRDVSLGGESTDLSAGPAS